MLDDEVVGYQRIRRKCEVEASDWKPQARQTCQTGSILHLVDFLTVLYIGFSLI